MSSLGHLVVLYFMTTRSLKSRASSPGDVHRRLTAFSVFFPQFELKSAERVL